MGGSDASTPATRRRGVLDLNEATFEQLRGLGMSVTQATRVIAYRERAEGFKSVDDMDTIPGFPKPMLEELKEKLSA
jgi:DNA uptake protein ComE-like DNA-binding protein